MFCLRPDARFALASMRENLTHPLWKAGRLALGGVRFCNCSDQRLVLLMYADQFGVQIVDTTLNLSLCRCGTFAGFHSVGKRRFEAFRSLQRCPLQTGATRLCGAELFIQPGGQIGGFLAMRRYLDAIGFKCFGIGRHAGIRQLSAMLHRSAPNCVSLSVRACGAGSVIGVSLP